MIHRKNVGGGCCNLCTICVNGQMLQIWMTLAVARYVSPREFHFELWMNDSASIGLSQTVASTFVPV